MCITSNTLHQFAITIRLCFEQFECAFRFRLVLCQDAIRFSLCLTEDFLCFRLSRDFDLILLDLLTNDFLGAQAFLFCTEKFMGSYKLAQ